MFMAIVAGIENKMMFYRWIVYIDPLSDIK